ncbi:hypothetical protein GCM10025860_10890 [Methanobacterium ferruginis]|nr:hypothetical protein GCM10025860_10890 [Methanobacterium ferruginis]
MATVGSAMGSKNDSEQAIATGTAYVPMGCPCAAANVTDNGTNIAESAILDITCVILTATTIKTTIIRTVDGSLPMKATISVISQLAAPV